MHPECVCVCVCKCVCACACACAYARVHVHARACLALCSYDSDTLQMCVAMCVMTCSAGGTATWAKVTAHHARGGKQGRGLVAQALKVGLKRTAVAPMAEGHE